jgi:hypothetical protein
MSIVSLVLGDQWISSSEGTLYLDGEPLGKVDGKLQQIVSHSLGMLVLSDKALVLLSQNGEWVDDLQVGREIPLQAPLSGVHVEGASVFLSSSRETIISEDLLNWKPSSHKSLGRPESDEEQHAPEEIRLKIETHGVGMSVTWERFLLDLHSGRLLGGQLGMLIVEVSAWGLVLLTFTGLYIWFIKLRVKEG